MRPFSTTEVGRLQSTAEGGMVDECVILRQTAPKVWTPEDEPTPCRFRDASRGGAANVFLAGATTPGTSVVLPLGTVLGKADRIRITKRLGRAVTPVDYLQDGQPEATSTAIVVELRKVAT
jgi:hypothetical protein